MTDLSIVIAHRGPDLGLWATIHSCEIALRNSHRSYGYVIVANGDERLTPEFHAMIKHLGSKVEQLVVHPTPMSPPSARQLGTAFAKGDTLFFLDNHCLVRENYFERALQSMNKYGMDMVHSATIFHSGEGTAYHYQLQLDKNFWAEASMIPPERMEPYKIAAGGHGGFAVRRKVWEEVEGYWNGFVGYGGEEIYFDLKMWMLGYNNWMDPEMVHYHFAGARPYSRHFTDAYFMNMMMCANIIGGEQWVYKIFQKFTKQFRAKSDRTMYELMREALSRSKDHATWISLHRQKTLDALLLWFTQAGIAH